MCVVGMLFFAYQKELLIIRSWSSLHTQYPTHANHAIEKRAVKLFFYKDHAWHHETQHVLWTYNLAENIRHTLSALCAVFDEEGITQEKMHIQSVALSKCMCHVYLSFDRSLLHSQQSIEQKAAIIEAILKTVREDHPTIHDVFFLTKHKLIDDSHLDMSKPWPIN